MVVAWLSAVVGWIVYQRSTGLGTTGALQEFIDVAGGAWWALLAFFVIYAVRPLVLFPASLLPSAAVFYSGPWSGWRPLSWELTRPPWSPIG